MKNTPDLDGPPCATCNGLGSEWAVTNSGQSVTANLTPSAFGQTVASIESSTSAYQFGTTSGFCAP